MQGNHTLAINLWSVSPGRRWFYRAVRAKIGRHGVILARWHPRSRIWRMCVLALESRRISAVLLILCPLCWKSTIMYSAGSLQNSQQPSHWQSSTLTVLILTANKTPIARIQTRSLDRHPHNSRLVDVVSSLIYKYILYLAQCEVILSKYNPVPRCAITLVRFPKRRGKRRVASAISKERLSATHSAEKT